MLIAQALGEYAGASTIVSAISSTLSTAQTFIFSVNARTWAILGLGVFLVLYLRNRRK